MIKLKNLIKEIFLFNEEKGKLNIIGSILDVNEVKSTKYYITDEDSVYRFTHGNTRFFNNRGINWRYNPQNETLYWWDRNIPELEKEAVEYHLKKKYGFEVNSQVLMTDKNMDIMDYCKHYNKMHGDLNENISNQTETSEFKKWFRGSKIVDDHGNPLIVYHGTQHLEPH